MKKYIIKLIEDDLALMNKRLPNYQLLAKQCDDIYYTRKLLALERKIEGVDKYLQKFIGIFN